MPEGSASAGSGAMKPGAVMKKISEVARELTEAGAPSLRDPSERHGVECRPNPS